jgi:drug/metabolite transporter (DMT)-like permease
LSISLVYKFRLFKKLADETNPILLTSIIILIGALMMLPALIYFSKDIKLFTRQKLIWAILASIFWIVIGEVLYLSGLSKITLSRTALLGLTFPLFAISLAIIFLGETITLKFIIAAVLMIVAYIILVI